MTFFPIASWHSNLQVWSIREEKKKNVANGKLQTRALQTTTAERWKPSYIISAKFKRTARTIEIRFISFAGARCSSSAIKIECAYECGWLAGWLACGVRARARVHE